LEKEGISMPKLTVEFNERAHELLRELAERNSMTKPEIILRAVALYKYLDDETHQKEEGRKIAITDDSGQVLKEIMIP